MTNHCVNGGKTTDDPNAADFWTARINPSNGLPYTNSDPASRTAWGVDENRNNTVGTLFDGYIGASHSCTSETYTGPCEASEPEIKNELWVADTFSNIKFSNNIHSFGGYFMWAPGTYLPNRDEGEARAREHRRREVLLRGRRPDPQPDQGGPRHGDPARADGPDRGRALLGGRQQRRRALVPPRRDRVQLRDRRRPLRQHDVVRGLGGRSDRDQAGEPHGLPAGRHDHVRQGQGEPGDPRRSCRSRRRPARARHRT